MAEEDRTVVAPIQLARAIASCDGCNKMITDIKHHCQQCPDFDYCSLCIISAAKSHPHHTLFAMNSNGTVPDEDQLKWNSTEKVDSKPDSALRLKGLTGDKLDVICPSCSQLTEMLPAMYLASRDESLQQKAREMAEDRRDISLHWRLRISKLVEATQRGCIFCTFILDHFFGEFGVFVIPTYEPIPSWYLLDGESEEREKLVMHAMKLLTELRSDVFVFAVTLLCTRKGSEPPNYDSLNFSCIESELDPGVLRTIKIFKMVGNPTLSFNIFAAEGDLSANQLKSRPPNAKPGSKEGLDKPLAWFRECKLNHGVLCRPKRPLNSENRPKRLLKISDETTVRLHEVQEGEKILYAALSYCWGGPQKIALTKATYDEKIIGISLSELPQSLHDGFKVAKALELEYLWIDALCIIQDDKADKIGEIAKMGDIYSNAEVTIAAANAMTVGEGFLRDISDQETGMWKTLLPIRYPIVDENAKTLQQAIEMPRKGVGTIWLMDEPQGLQMPALDHLSRRGWCMQERLLSPRFLNYGRWPTWRCNHHVQSDGGWYQTDDKLDPTERYFMQQVAKLDTEGTVQLDHFNTRKTLRTWHLLVNRYTRREFSNEEDRLLAIGGIAEKFQHITGFIYCAGLWQQNLLEDMMWFTNTKEWRIRPKYASAPTWSWTSVVGPVKYGEITDDATPLAKILGCQVFPQESETTQLPGRGYVQIEGLIREVDKDDVESLFKDQDMGPSPPKSNNSQQWMQSILEFIADTQQTQNKENDVPDTLPEKVFALATFKRDWYVKFEQRVEKTSVSGLLLRRTGNNYERIGAFLNEDRPWLDQSTDLWVKQVIVIE